MLTNVEVILSSQHIWGIMTSLSIFDFLCSIKIKVLNVFCNGKLVSYSHNPAAVVGCRVLC